MKTKIIRRLDDHLVEAIRKAAYESRKSINQWILDVLTQAVKKESK